jgi:AcrR family transcriptional regulator
MNEPVKSESREKVFEVADRLFSQRGYVAVTLRDIAQELNIKQASLYYHVKGKEELFVEVMERGLERHREGLSALLNNPNLDWKGQLHAVAGWFLTQPPMNVTRVIQTDMPELSKEHADHLMDSMYRCMFVPLAQIFIQAQRESPQPLPDPPLLVGAFLALLEGLRNAPSYGQPFKRGAAADQIIDVLIRGLEPR